MRVTNVGVEVRDGVPSGGKLLASYEDAQDIDKSVCLMNSGRCDKMWPVQEECNLLPSIPLCLPKWFGIARRG